MTVRVRLESKSIHPKMAAEIYEAMSRNWDMQKVFEIIFPYRPIPQKVLFQPRGQNSTVVFWGDGTKTVVKCDDRDTYSKEAGLALCYMKKMLGSSRAFNDVLKEWCSDD